MSQVDNLLNSLSVDEGAVYTTEPATEGHIVVGNDRFITVPEELKRIAVQHDHDIETVTFDCPRYWDNHDMSQMKVYINYLLPNGDPGSYIAKNVAADGDLMHFDWTISRDVTLHKGNISFLVCVKKTDVDGNEEKHWNSELCRDLYISEGLECSETILSEYPDIITDLLTRMDTVEAVAVSYEEMEAAASAAEYAKSETIAMSRLVNENARFVQNQVKTLGDSFANPIKRTARGEIIRVDDVSPIEHTAYVTVEYEPYIDLSTVTLTACGKNLFDPAKILAAEGWKESDGEYSGLPMYLDKLYRYKVGVPMFSSFKPNTQYTLSLDGRASFTDETVNTAASFCFGYDDGTSDYFVINTSEYSKYTITSRAGKNITGVYASYGHNIRTFLRNIQLEEGTEVTEYEPYKGVTYTPSEDGTVDISAVYPTMTLYTDKDVEMAVEYNVDSNVYLQELKDLINAGGSQFNTNLTDTVTGEVYSMAITNGKLTLTKLEV